MPIQDFEDQLKALGYAVQAYPGGRLLIEYEIPVGRFQGRSVRLGLTVADEFPASCPGGPHISPSLLQVHPANDVGHPVGGVHDDSDYRNAVGGDWQYWSRPFPGWGSSDRSVRSYMAFIRGLFASQ